MNNIFHVWDGNESESPDDVADVFEDNWLNDIRARQVDDFTWESITVTPLDVGNPADPIIRGVSLAGTNANEALPTGNHVWIKLFSDDNGFKSGGKMIPGFAEDDNNNGVVEAARLALIQTAIEDLLIDLIAAGLTLAIFRPSLSTPGFPSISTVSTVLARGFGSNNRRQREFQL